MKKILLLMVVPFVFNFAISAQVTQTEADSIVLERMNTEVRPHTVYAKDNLQADTANISTFMGELLELDYPCWIYYVRYDEQADTIPAKRRYFVVKESSGSVLMVNTHNNVSPPDLETWRKVPPDPEPDYPIEIPFTDYSLNSSETGCDWNYSQIKADSIYVINSQTELLTLVDRAWPSFSPPYIDFNLYSLVFVYGNTNDYGITNLDKNLRQLSKNEYELNVDVTLNDAIFAQQWVVAVLTKKITGNSSITPNIEPVFLHTNVCDVNNPLTDLPWFQNVIALYEPIQICQCAYRDGIGFLLLVIDGAYLMNCEGTYLCLALSFDMPTCPQYNIDFSSMKLIWSR
ncbi:MAG: hypothetical protein FWH36_08340 [Lentimicrobiaceae bacterium]|nr:hypothetical protein [Lentimicrobiaceae bacterium]